MKVIIVIIILLLLLLFSLFWFKTPTGNKFAFFPVKNGWHKNGIKNANYEKQNLL